MTCQGKCETPPNEGIRKTWWCGFKSKTSPPDHQAHDHQYKGQWFHCYG